MSNPPRWSDRIIPTVCPRCPCPIQRSVDGDLVEGLALHLHRIHGVSWRTAVEQARAALP